ncbi:MAG: ribosome maturation factor RimM [Tannerella sp.]|jgi:16S rRNA processing protein RimM|nr:ribosome maturation factor RimM [Tannerella sp.]
MIRKEELFQIGYFSKPHGIKGELSLHTDYAEVFDEIEESYLVCEMDGLFVPFFIDTLRSKKNASVVLVKFENVDNELAAKKFSNKAAYCPLEIMRDYSPEDAGSWDFFIGYCVADRLMGELGEVTEVDESTINTLFKINYQGKELLVPMAEELIVSVDHENRQLTVSLPEGLIDL